MELVPASRTCMCAAEACHASNKCLGRTAAASTTVHEDTLSPYNDGFLDQSPLGKRKNYHRDLANVVSYQLYLDTLIRKLL